MMFHSETICELPAEVGILALSGTVLFPGSLVPLYIFEPRYRLMLARALESHRMFALGCIEDTNLEPHPIGGIGVVRACVKNPDGTYHLILQGLCRVRFVEWVQTEPYFIARIIPMPSRQVKPEEAAPIMERLRTLCRQLQTVQSGMSPRLEAFLDEIHHPQIFSDLLAATLISNPCHRKLLLEECDPLSRLEMLCSFLAEMVRAES